MAVKAPADPSWTRSKQLRQLGQALGQSDASVRLVTFDPENDVLAVFVDAAQDKSEHERAAIRVWIEWLDRIADEPDFQLFNFSELPGEDSKKRLVDAYA